MTKLKKIPLILSILSIITFFSPLKAEIKVVASIKPIHPLGLFNPINSNYFTFFNLYFGLVKT